MTAACPRPELDQNDWTRAHEAFPGGEGHDV
jgi:hypothetical protein